MTPTCCYAYEEHTDPARPGVVRALELLPASFLALFHNVPVPHAVSGDVPQPVDRVEIVVLANAGRQVVKGVHDVAGPWHKEDGSKKKIIKYTVKFAVLCNINDVTYQGRSLNGQCKIISLDLVSETVNIRASAETMRTSAYSPTV